MTENSKEHKKTILTIVSIIIIIIAAIIVGVVFLLRPKEQYTSKGDKNQIVAALSCKSDTVESPFFHIDTAAYELHEVKFTFAGDSVDKMSYTYTGNFSDSEAEKKASSLLHAKYNEYMNTTTVEFSDLSPNFSNIDNQLVISLFLDEKTFTSGTAKLVFLRESDVSQIKKYSIENLRAAFEKSGFSCKVSD